MSGTVILTAFRPVANSSGRSRAPRSIGFSNAPSSSGSSNPPSSSGSSNPPSSSGSSNPPSSSGSSNPPSSSGSSNPPSSNCKRAYSITSPVLRLNRLALPGPKSSLYTTPLISTLISSKPTWLSESTT